MGMSFNNAFTCSSIHVTKSTKKGDGYADGLRARKRLLVASKLGLVGLDQTVTTPKKIARGHQCLNEIFRKVALDARPTLSSDGLHMDSGMTTAVE